MKLADSSCMICVFNEINRPYILMDWMKRGYKIVITQQVFNELKDNKQTFKKVNPEIKKGNIDIKSSIKDAQLEAFNKRYPTLGIGESSSILTALNLKKQGKRYYLVLDDAQARKVAKGLNLNLTGTYGLLKTLMEKRHIDEKKFQDCKSLMEKSNFRINFNKIK